MTELHDLDCGCDPKRLAAVREAWRPLNDQQALCTLHYENKQLRADRDEQGACAQAAEATIAAVRRLCEREVVLRERMSSGHSLGVLSMSRAVLAILDAPAASANAARGEEKPR